MNVNEAIGWYLDARAGSLRPQTWAKHKMTLRKLGETFGQFQLSAVTDDDLRGWRDSFGVSPASANKYIDRINAFFTYCVRTSKCQLNPCELIDPLDEPPARRVRLPRETLPLMVEAARHPRDKVMIQVALELLLRGGELAELRVSDVLPGALRVMVEKQKGELAEDEMAISDSLAGALADWLRYYRRVAGLVPAESYLFPRMVGRRTGDEYSYRLCPAEKIAHPEEVIKLALRAAGVPVTKGTGVHAIRRTCARLLFDHLVTRHKADRALSHISSLMHHSSRQTTELYLGITGDRVLRNTMVRETGVTPLTLAMAKVDETDGSHLSEQVVYSNRVNRV